jgi:predicted dehydrogenase
MHYCDRLRATSDEQVKSGVIGYGYSSPNLVRNFANTDGCHVVRVSDLDASNLMPCVRPYPDVTTTDFRDLIEDRRINAVAIATPAHRNFELNMVALRAGRHVIVEEPLAQTSDQVCRLLDEVKRRKLILMIDHTFEYTPAVQKNPQLISEGVSGEIFYYNGTRASLGLFQNDINVIWDHAEHDLSYIQYILNEAPVTVSATRGDPFQRDAGKHGADRPVLRGQLRGAYQRHLAFAGSRCGKPSIAAAAR